MTMPIARAVVVAWIGIVVSSAVVRGQDVPTASVMSPATAEQRAQALLGLGRIARDEGRCTDADARFHESAALRPFEAAQREEHFWIAAQCHPVRALQLAAALVADRRASADVHARRLALLRDPLDLAAQRRALLEAERAYPADPRWAAPRADLALTLERLGEAHASREVWEAMPAPTRDAHPEWEASWLRVVARTSRRGAVAPALDTYTARYPQDAGMRALAIEAWADAGQPARALALLAPSLADEARLVDLRRAADLARAAGQDSQARGWLSRAHAHPDHGPEDSWRWAEALAEARETPALRRLLIEGRLDAGPCRERLVHVVTMAGEDALLAEMLPELPTSCRGYADVARRIATVRLADGDAPGAERWLAPLRAADALDDTSRVLLARALTARQAWTDVDAVLTSMVVARPQPEAADLLAWAWHALGRSAEAWQFVRRVLDPEHDTAERQAGWAALALAAGDGAAAGRLAHRALDSSRDVEARVVLASRAARTGSPEDVARWLAPVATRLRDPGHLLLWLDARYELEGPAVALEDAASLVRPTESDVDVLSRRAAWSAMLGRDDDARAFAARVQAHDPARGARLDVEMALAAGDPSRAWERLTTAPASTIEAERADWLRLRLEVALGARRWDAAAAAFGALTGFLSEDERLLAGARLELGRTGVLTPDTRVALADLVAGGTHVASAQLVLAHADLAAGDPAAALARVAGRTVARATAFTPVEARSVAAAALLALGRPAEVLALVPEGTHQPVGLLLARGQALMALGSPSEARALLEPLARSTGRAEAWTAWADTLDTAEAQVDVLGRAVALHDRDADVRAAYARALVAAGRVDEGAAEARTALALRPGARAAWQVALTAQALQDEAGLQARVLEARAAVGESPRDTLWLGEAVAGLPRLSREAVTLAVTWMQSLPAPFDAEGARVQARMAVATGDWVLAADAIERLHRLAPDDVGVARLEAQVTAWSGAHAQAVPLYEAYLALRPTDITAWREFARLLSWREDREGAARAYARVHTLTDSPAVDAEAESRLATLRRDWTTAARAAAAWRALEPAALDPLVDLAQALEQQGDAGAARRAYDELAGRPDLPDPVRLSLDAYRRRQAAQGGVAVRLDRSEGFGGQRLLERRDTVLSAETGVPAARSLRLTGVLAEGALDTGASDPTLSLTEGRLGGQMSPGAGWLLAGFLGGSRVGGRAYAQGALRLVIPAGARVSLDAGVERRPFWENAATLEAGLQTTTGRVGVRLRGTGMLDGSASVEVGRLTDGARRMQIDAHVSRRFGRGARVYAVRLSGFAFGFDASRAAYFSPQAFGRLDLEAGLTQWFGPGAVIRDGRFAFTGQGGFGLDTDGVPYGLASGSVVVPLGGMVGLAAEGRWTSARVYRAWSATVGLQVQPGGSGSARSGRTHPAAGGAGPR